MNATCVACGIKHPRVEASGIFYCPNALCAGCGGAWFRTTLSSYKQEGQYHTISERERIIKGIFSNLKRRIFYFKFRRRKKQ